MVAGSVTLSQSKDEEVKKLLGGDMEKMRNTKGILMSILMIGVVAMAAGVGTLAYFSDTETSTGNTFTAGTLNLTVDDQDGANIVKFTVSDIKPGDSDVGTWKLVNAGSLDGYIDLENISVTDEENVNPESETNTTEPGDLGANMDVVLFWDDGAGGGTAGNGVQDGNETTIYSGKLKDIASSYDENYPLANGATTYVSMNWSVASTVGNDIQGDKSTLNIAFELAQTAGQ